MEHILTETRPFFPEFPPSLLLSTENTFSTSQCVYPVKFAQEDGFIQQQMVAFLSFMMTFVLPVSQAYCLLSSWTYPWQGWSEAIT